MVSDASESSHAPASAVLDVMDRVNAHYQRAFLLSDASLSAVVCFSARSSQTGEPDRRLRSPNLSLSRDMLSPRTSLTDIPSFPSMTVGTRASREAFLRDFQDLPQRLASSAHHAGTEIWSQTADITNIHPTSDGVHLPASLTQESFFSVADDASPDRQSPESIALRGTLGLCADAAVQTR